MKASIAALLALMVALVAALAVTAGYLRHELVAARTLAQQSAQSARYLSARIAELERLRLSYGAAADRARDASGAASHSSGTSPALAAEGSRQPGTTPRAMRNSPAMLRVTELQARSHAKRMYADFVAEYELPEEEANRLYGLLAQQDVDLVLGATEEVDPADEQARWSERDRLLREQATKLLGEARAARLQEYQETFAARANISQLRDQLEAVDIPMSEAQRRRLVKAVVEDRQQFPAELAAGQTTAEMQLAYLDWERQQAERLTAVARTILTPQQMRHYEDLQEVQREMLR